VTNHKHQYSKFCQWYCHRIADIKLPVLTFYGGDGFATDMQVKWMPYCAACALHRLRNPYTFSSTKMFKKEIKPMALLINLVAYDDLQSFEGYSIPEEPYYVSLM
jgi:hypothetical protein